MPKWKYIYLILISVLIFATRVVFDYRRKTSIANTTSVEIILKNKKKDFNVPFDTDNNRNQIKYYFIGANESVLASVISERVPHTDDIIKTASDTVLEESTENKNDKIPNDNRQTDNRLTVYDMIRRIHQTIKIEEPSVQPLVFSCNETSIDDIDDLLCMDPPKFLPDYKNPCWYTEADEFRCLPYFQLVGMGKCGSSDLFDRIAQHPDVLENRGARNKETWWWSWRRYGLGFHGKRPRQSFKDYLNYFQWDEIQHSPSKNLVTGDGTPMDMSDNSGWPSIPQNKGLAEPKYITPHLIKHINPSVKLIVILRDPVERLFSDYFFHGLGTMTTAAFHKEVIHSIGLLYNCILKYSFRACLYDIKLINGYTARLHVGFYSIFLQDWLRVFPRKQFHIIRTEDYSSSLAEHMQQLYTFLDLRELPSSAMKNISDANKKFETERKKQAGHMEQETQNILRELYRPFNTLLATLLNDDRFLWLQS